MSSPFHLILANQEYINDFLILDPVVSQVRFYYYRKTTWLIEFQLTEKLSSLRFETERFSVSCQCSLIEIFWTNNADLTHQENLVDYGFPLLWKITSIIYLEIRMVVLKLLMYNYLYNVPWSSINCNLFCWVDWYINPDFWGTDVCGRNAR